MAEMESMEGWKQEAFTWQLRINEVEERVAHLQRELEIVNFIIEQPEVKVAALELCLQSGKKKGGSKEVGCLIAAETEKFEHWNSLSRIRLRKAKSGKRGYTRCRRRWQCRCQGHPNFTQLRQLRSQTFHNGLKSQNSL